MMQDNMSTNLNYTQKTDFQQQNIWKNALVLIILCFKQIFLP